MQCGDAPLSVSVELDPTASADTYPAVSTLSRDPALTV